MQVQTWHIRCGESKSHIISKHRYTQLHEYSSACLPFTVLTFRSPSFYTLKTVFVATRTFNTATVQTGLVDDQHCKWLKPKGMTRIPCHIPGVKSTGDLIRRTCFGESKFEDWHTFRGIRAKLIWSVYVAVCVCVPDSRQVLLAYKLYYNTDYVYIYIYIYIYIYVWSDCKTLSGISTKRSYIMRIVWSNQILNSLPIRTAERRPLLFQTRLPALFSDWRYVCVCAANAHLYVAYTCMLPVQR